jgi:pimeloyl-ACP methyl ester carboxylesterase
MKSTFYKLLDNTLAEIRRRDPSCTSALQATIYNEEIASTYRQHPACKQLTSEVIRQALDDGLKYVSQNMSISKQASIGIDPIGRFLCDSIVDAFCADKGLLGLRPHDGFNGSISEVLAQDYSERRISEHTSYFVRNGGTRPLLLINATGTPITIWSQFLADHTHDFKIILPRRLGGDLFRGGLQQHVDIAVESADLAAILDTELLERVDILAWCNGARVAIDLTNRRGHEIASMVLLGPMLKGIQGVTPALSTFERDLEPLLEAVIRQPTLAPIISQAISKQSMSPDWTRWTNSPVARAQALFALPAKEHVCDMTASLTDPASLINIARRVASDERYPMDRALGNLKARTMIILGSADNIVSNELVTSAIKQICCNAVVKVDLNGSGHYIHDLQYHYFRWLLTDFLDGNHLPSSSARMSVENLGGRDDGHVTKY